MSEEPADNGPEYLDLTAYERPEQLERLGPQRMINALKWFGYAEETLPKNGIHLSRRLYATKGIPYQEIGEDFFDNWEDDYHYNIDPQFLDLRNITRVSQLEELGLLRVRSALKALGLKSGGHLKAASGRLFATRGVPREKLPESFFPTKAGQRSTRKWIQRKKELQEEDKKKEVLKKRVNEFYSTVEQPSKRGAANNSRGMPPPLSSSNLDRLPMRGILKKQGYSHSNSAMPPPPPPAPPSEPPPPPPPPPPQQSSNYATSTASTTLQPVGAATAATMQHYPPPSAYVPQAYNMYMGNQPTTGIQSTLAGYAYGMTPTGGAAASAGYTSTGTYIAPASTAATASASSYVVNSAAVQKSTQSWSQSSAGTGDSSMDYSTNYPTTVTTAPSSSVYSAGYFTQSGSTNASSTSNYSTSYPPSMDSTSYPPSTASAIGTTYDHRSSQSASPSYSNQSAASNYDNYLSNSTSAAESAPKTTRPTVPYTTTNWKASTDNFTEDDVRGANTWLANYGVQRDKEIEAEKRFKSRWSKEDDKVKGVYTGKSLATGGKFKMTQCKDCNVFLSTEEQYNDHMASEKHIVKVGGDINTFLAAQAAKAEAENRRPGFHPYWRKERPPQTQQGQRKRPESSSTVRSLDLGGMVQTPMSQRTIDEVEEEKARRYGMRYEVKLSSVRDPGGFAPGRFGKLKKPRGGGRSGKRNREKDEQFRERRNKRAGKVTRSDDEDDVYRRLPNQRDEHRGLGYVEKGGLPEIKDVSLDSFRKKGQLHMDTGLRLHKYEKAKREESWGAPALPASGVPQFGMAPPPADYDMPRQSLVPKRFGEKKEKEFEISFDTPMDIMKAAIVIPLLVPFLEIPGMDKISETLRRGLLPPGLVGDPDGMDLLDASKNLAKDLEKAQGSTGRKDDEFRKNDDEDDMDDDSKPTLSKFLQQSGKVSLMSDANPNQGGGEKKNKLLSNLTGLMDKPDVLHNPAVLSFLAQTQPEVVKKVKPAKPVMKKLPPRVIHEIISKAKCIADQMEMQMEEMRYRQEEMVREQMEILYGGPGLLGKNPYDRDRRGPRPLRRTRSLDGLDNDGYYGDNDYDEEYDDPYGDDYEDGLNNDQYSRRYGFEEEDYEDEYYSPRGRPDRMEFDPRNRFSGPRGRSADRMESVPRDRFGGFDDELEQGSPERARRGRSSDRMEFDPRDRIRGPRGHSADKMEFDPRGRFQGSDIFDQREAAGEDDEYSAYRRAMEKKNKRQVGGEKDKEDIREARRQRRREKRERLRKERQQAGEEEDDNDDEEEDEEDSQSNVLLRSALPPQLLASVGKNQGRGETEEELERKRELRRQRRKEKRQQNRQESSDGDDNSTQRIIRSALPPQLLAGAFNEEDTGMDVDAGNGRGGAPDDDNEFSVYKAKMQKMGKKVDVRPATRPVRSAIPPQMLDDTMEQRHRGRGPLHPGRSALPPQMLDDGIEQRHRGRGPPHPGRRAFPPQMLDDAMEQRHPGRAPHPGRGAPPHRMLGDPLEEQEAGCAPFPPRDAPPHRMLGDPLVEQHPRRAPFPARDAPPHRMLGDPLVEQHPRRAPFPARGTPPHRMLGEPLEQQHSGRAPFRPRGALPHPMLGEPLEQQHSGRAPFPTRGAPPHQMLGDPLVQGHPGRASFPPSSAIPPQMLGDTNPMDAAGEDDEYSAYRNAMMKKRKREEGKSGAGGKNVRKGDVETASSAEANAAKNEARSPMKRGKEATVPEGDEFSVYRAKMQKKHSSADEELEKKRELRRQRRKAKREHQRKQEGVEEDDDGDGEDDSQGTQTHRSALPPQLLAMMGAQAQNSEPPKPSGGGKNFRPAKPPAAAGKKKRGHPGFAKEMESMEVEVEVKQLNKAESNLAKPDEEKQETLKTFKIPKKTPPQKAAEIKEKAKQIAAKFNPSNPSQNRPHRSALPPHLFASDSQTPNTEKQTPNKETPDKEKPPTKEKSAAKEQTTPSHPIRSAIPAQLLMMAAGEDDSASSSSKKADAKTEKAKKMGLPTEGYQQQKGGGTMTRRSTRSRKR